MSLSILKMNKTQDVKNNSSTNSTNNIQNANNISNSIFSKYNSVSGSSTQGNNSIFSKAKEDDTSASNKSSAKQLLSGYGNQVSDAKEGKSASEDFSKNASNVVKDSKNTDKVINKELSTSEKTLQTNSNQIKNIDQKNKSIQTKLNTINRKMDTEAEKIEEERAAAEETSNETTPQDDTFTLDIEGTEKKDENGQPVKKDTTTNPFESKDESGSSDKMESYVDQSKALTGQVKTNGKNIEKIINKSDATADKTGNTVNSCLKKTQEDADISNEQNTDASGVENAATITCTFGTTMTSIGGAMCSNPAGSTVGTKLLIGGAVTTGAGGATMAASKVAQGDTMGAFTAANQTVQAGASGYSGYNNAQAKINKVDQGTSNTAKTIEQSQTKKTAKYESSIA